MTFILVSLVAAAATFLPLTLHRFLTTRGKSQENSLHATVAGNYWKWIVERTFKGIGEASIAKLRAVLKGLGFWKYPDLEKWLFVGFYGSLVYLAVSGFFFAFFVPRGLFGYPLLLHVVAGAIFAVSLTLIVFLRAKDYTFAMSPPTLTLSLLNPRRLGITAVKVQYVAFWAFALAGFLLTASALMPMLPVFRTGGQKFMFELHRYGALAAVLSGAVFVSLESFNSKRTKP